MSCGSYDRASFKGLSFHDAVPRFLAGQDNPRAYLERCLDSIAAKDGVVRAFVVLNETGARASADASAARYKAGRALSAIDGMPIGIKDLIETADMPTQMGCGAFTGNFPKRDSIMVRALRDAGAVIIGKTVTAELGMAHPGPTTNPFDPRRTPGGSSSGSAAAVGASMIPAAIGTQVGGSIIRPASYCGNVALKPTQGAINRGERQSLSQSTAGVHANSFEDMWAVAIEIARRAGGDPGAPGLFGPLSAPTPIKPARLIVMETEGWADLDAPSLAAFEGLLAKLRAAGVEILRRGDHPLIEGFERALAQGKAITADICAFEQRAGLQHLAETAADRVSPRLFTRLQHGTKVDLETYRARLLERDELRRRLVSLAPLADGLIALSSPGPAPVWLGDQPGQPIAPRPTGDISFNAGTSALGCPAVTVPLLAVEGMPVGVQIIGQWHEDARATAIAAWVAGVA
jgi:Asp-tRNA(Asn)/Glu-tRNA(Gln) amidotransferase A subunit family amidase